MARKQVNFKLPQELVEALDAKAESENTNRTELVIQGIRHILGISKIRNERVDKSIERRVEKIEKRLYEVETQRVDESVYENLHRLAHQLEDLKALYNQIEQSVSELRSRQADVQPICLESIPQFLSLTELAQRLKVDRSNLSKAKRNKTAAEFADYTRGRDPSAIAWCFNESAKIFQPV